MHLLNPPERMADAGGDGSARSLRAVAPGSNSPAEAVCIRELRYQCVPFRRQSCGAFGVACCIGVVQLVLDLDQALLVRVTGLRVEVRSEGPVDDHAAG